MSERALKLWVVLARAYAAVEGHSASDISRHGLTPAEFGILEALYHKGPLLTGDVRRRVLVSSGGTTYLVDRLEKRGLVRRRACPDDRRARYVELTPAGRRLIARIFPDHGRAIEASVAGLSSEEQEQAIALLRRLGLHAAKTLPDEG